MRFKAAEEGGSLPIHHVLVAVIYTTPWDTYLVATGVRNGLAPRASHVHNASHKDVERS